MSGNKNGFPALNLLCNSSDKFYLCLINNKGLTVTCFICTGPLIMLAWFYVGMPIIPVHATLT